MYCTQCGKELKDGIRFCTKCGAVIKAQIDIAKLEKASEHVCTSPESNSEETPVVDVTELLQIGVDSPSDQEQRIDRSEVADETSDNTEYKWLRPVVIILIILIVGFSGAAFWALDGKEAVVDILRIK